MASLTIRELSKNYPGGIIALRNVNLAVANTECVACVGPSASGKTSLLRLVAGLEACDRGVVCFDGRDMSRVATHRRNVAMVFQEDSLYPHLSVFENIAFPLRTRSISAPRVSAEVDRMAEQLGVGHVLRRRPSALSGGERQRVALARALVRPPSVLLLDEPFSHLDAHLRRDLRETLQQIRGADPVTTIFVTHDQREALALGDRIAVMHEGAVAQLGTSRELMAKPVNRFTARFIGDPPVNLLDGNVREGRFESAGLAFDLSPEQAARLPAGPVVLGIRPYAIQPGQPRESHHVVLLSASPRASLMLGSHWETRLPLGGGDELVAVTPHPLTTSEFHFEKSEALFFATSKDGRNLLLEA